jgi:hypothetical protein
MGLHLGAAKRMEPGNCVIYRVVASAAVASSFTHGRHVTLSIDTVYRVCASEHRAFKTRCFHSFFRDVIQCVFKPSQLVKSGWETSIYWPACVLHVKTIRV